MEASSTRLMTYRGFSSSLPDFSVFARSSPKPVAVRSFLIVTKIADCVKTISLPYITCTLPRVKFERDKKLYVDISKQTYENEQKVKELNSLLVIYSKSYLKELNDYYICCIEKLFFIVNIK